MDKLIPVQEPALKSYFVASSIEEALAYLTAHTGQAQVIAGGTTLMPLVQRGQALARYLVDVSRIASLRRIRLEDDYLILGGAVTLAQVLHAEVISTHLPALQDMARSASTPRLRGLATLAGSIVNAYGNSSVTSTLIAQSAEAEIANLTGSQWLPVRSLLVRPGTCRVNSMSEILVSIRIPLMRPGEGSAVTRLDGYDGTREASSVYAVSLGINQAVELLSWVCAVVGTHAATPRLCQINDLADGRQPTVETLRRAFSQWAVAETPQALTQDGPAIADRVAAISQQTFDMALQRARARLANGLA